MKRIQYHNLQWYWRPFLVLISLRLTRWLNRYAAAAPPVKDLATASADS
jgi:hypothetical protein